MTTYPETFEAGGHTWHRFHRAEELPPTEQGGEIVAYEAWIGPQRYAGAFETVPGDAELTESFWRAFQRTAAMAGR